jgi:peptidoglycan/xylan/chitin deacetylase (PgdA/CDA1 family)
MPSLKSLATSALFAASVFGSVLDKRAQQYGVVITACTTPGVVAVSFDDGPSIYTESVLDKFKAAGQRATFFVNGLNYGSIYDYGSTLKRMVAEGHQIGSHTWDHADLTTLSAAGVTSEMTQLENAMMSLVGFFPFYMRPPYLATNSVVLSTLAALKYVVVSINIDTLDWQNTSPTLIQQSVANFKNGLDAGGSISLEHDPLVNTANTLVPAILQELANRGLRCKLGYRLC